MLWEMINRGNLPFIELASSMSFEDAIKREVLAGNRPKLPNKFEMRNDKWMNG